MRRLFDFLLALTAIIVTLPLWVVISLLILIFSPGPIFFRHRRIGQGGEPFNLVKFRTMRHAALGAGLTIAGDSRITPVGKFLRRYKLDELPQFLNVLSGTMAIVGPRPEIEEFVSHYTDEQKQILQFMPGLTDSASLTYRDEETVLARHKNPMKVYVENILPDKVRLSLEYQRQRSCLSDLGIIGRTIIAIFKGAK